MSLLRLLTAGKSLVGVSDAGGRYRVTSQRLLPQFGSGRNPFTSKPKTEPAQAGARSPEEHGGNGASAARAGLPGPGGEPAAALQREVRRRAVLATFHARKLAEALWRRIAALPSKWKARLTDRLAGPRGKLARTAIPRFTRPPVQGELSLDRIKVVRNDLSDADLEVISVKPATPALGSVEKAGRAETAWGRVRGRILGANKT